MKIRELLQIYSGFTFKIETIFFHKWYKEMPPLGSLLYADTIWGWKSFFILETEFGNYQGR